VVLSPCLLVVIAASLNKQITTDALYGAGRWVFLLTSGLYLVACLLCAQRQPLQRVGRPTWRRALADTSAPLLQLGSYALVALLIVGFFRLALASRLDEHSAPIILPLVLLALLAFERWRAGTSAIVADIPVAHVHALGTMGAPRRAHDDHALFLIDQVQPRSLRHAVRRATTETSGHIGALLTLMAASVCVGGIVQRSGLMALVPSHVGSPAVAMAMLVAMLVVIGMCMDPYGAVILVSASIADVAYRNGIAPTHFWIVVLVAFELGYLMPPIALNQLLARRVIGAAAPGALQPAAGGSFWQRHMGTLLPVGVMTTALLLVAFVPLGWKW
jgi:TRAP-type C4-dicarboxylate transport system permease large subunit